MTITNLNLNKSIRELHDEFAKLVDILNHRLTNVESDMRWMKRIGYYLAGVITAIGIKIMFGGV